MTNYAIPGQSTEALTPAPVDIRRAIEAIEAVSSAMAATEPFGWLDPPRCSAAWDASSDRLRISIDEPAAWIKGGGPWPDMVCAWGRLWDNGDWYEVGWHPDDRYFALRADVARTLWTALNLGKGKPPRHGR